MLVKELLEYLQKQDARAEVLVVNEGQVDKKTYMYPCSIMHVLKVRALNLEYLPEPEPWEWSVCLFIGLHDSE